MELPNQIVRSALPKVSIGLPTYNSYGKIRNALNSIWEQNYPNLEIIISDNCSSDDTPKVFAEVIKDHPETRYFRQAKNIGLIPNFDFVLGKATGEFFMWLADDDALEPGILKTYVEFLMNHPDYSLVSGQIKYLFENKPVFCEKDFNMEERDDDLRVIHYYSKVVYGALFHGLMRKSMADQIPLRNAIGNDFHFVASLAYMGKIKTLDCVGYNKRLNGASRNFKHYAAVIGAPWFSETFPRLAIARDAFSEIFYSPVFALKSWYSKLFLAISCSGGLLFNYYGKEFPFIVGGKLKRYLKKSFS